MLRNAHDRRIDHLEIAVLGLGDGVHEPIPMTGLAPAVEAIVAGGRSAPTDRATAPQSAGPRGRRSGPAGRRPAARLAAFWEEEVG